MLEDIPFRVLAAGNEPDFRTIADFRKTHLTALQGFFEQVLQMARELGAAARRPRGARWEQGQGERVEAQGDELRPDGRESNGSCATEVKQLLAQAEATDAAEDAEYGADRRGDELPAELQRRESRLAPDSRGETGRWRRGPKTRPRRPASRRTRPSRIRKPNTTSRIPSRGS